MLNLSFSVFLKEAPVCPKTVLIENKFYWKDANKDMQYRLALKLAEEIKVVCTNKLPLVRFITGSNKPIIVHVLDRHCGYAYLQPKTRTHVFVVHDRQKSVSCSCNKYGLEPNIIC